MTVLTYAMGLINSFFAFQNFFAYRLGTSAGQKFNYEMDQVFGKLLGIKNYSKVEGLLLALSAYGCFTSVFEDDYSNFLTVMFMQMGNIYFFFCVIYFFVMKDEAMKICGVFIGLTSWIMLYRIRSGLFDWEVYGDKFVNFSIVCLGVCILGGRAMVNRATKPEFDKMIKRWVKIDALCKRNPEFEWKVGKDCPEGFDE